MMSTMTKTYDECMSLPTFEQRVRYLMTHSVVGDETLGDIAYLKARIYNSSRWIRLKNKLIIRDKGCDLACEGHMINGYDTHFGRIKVPVVLHHINPLTRADLLCNSDKIYDPQNLIICGEDTHRAIHYSDYYILADEPIERKPNDTIPWKR